MSELREGSRRVADRAARIPDERWTEGGAVAWYGPRYALDDLEQTAPANADGLSYDASSGLYTYVWKTQKAYSGTCRQLVLSLTDGNVVRFDFTFVK